MLKFVVYFGLLCAVLLISVNSLPVQNENAEVEQIEPIESVAVENKATAGVQPRVQRAADPHHHHKHHNRPYPYDEGCRYCGGGGGGGGGFSGAASQAFSGNSGGYGGRPHGGRPFGGGGGGGSSANSQAFSVSSPFGSFSGSASSANSFNGF